MRAARLAEATNQRIVRGLQKQNLSINSLFYLLEDLRKAVQRPAFANVNHQRCTLDLGRLSCEISKALDQFQWKIVDAVIAKIFKSLEYGALSRPTHSRDEYQLRRSPLLLGGSRMGIA